MIVDASLGASCPAHTPMEINLKLTTSEYDASFVLNPDDYAFNDVDLYRRLIVELLYFTMTRPDIAFSVQHLSQFVHQTDKSHYDAAIRVIR